MSFQRLCHKLVHCGARMNIFIMSFFDVFCNECSWNLHKSLKTSSDVDIFSTSFNVSFRQFILFLDQINTLRMHSIKTHIYFNVVSIAIVQKSWKETSLTPLDSITSVFHTYLDCERNQIWTRDWFCPPLVKLPALRRHKIQIIWLSFWCLQKFLLRINKGLDVDICFFWSHHYGS